MAAILCRGMTQMCETTCRKTATLPCCATNADDDEDDEMARGGASSYDCCCGLCGYCGDCCGCGGYLHALKHICTNPFGIFVTVTVVSNIPPMLIALTEVGNLHFEAGQEVCYATLWLLVNFLFCWVHIIASFYIAVSINHHRSYNSDEHNKKNNKRHHRSTTISTASLNHTYSYGPDRTIFRRASNLFCYDPVLAVYIMTTCIYVGFVAVPRLFHLDDPNFNNNQSGNNNEDDNLGASSCSLYIHEKVIATVGFAWAFLGFGMGALALSFGFAYVDATRRSQHEKAAEESEFATHLSDLDGTEETSVYTSMNNIMNVMESGGGANSAGKGGGGGSAGDASKRGGGSGRHTAIALDNEYVPPMIAYDEHDDGIELLSEPERQSRRRRNYMYEQQLKQKRVEETLNNVILSDDDIDDGAEFVTDFEETDLEEDDEEEDDWPDEEVGTTSVGNTDDDSHSRRSSGRRRRQRQRHTTTRRTTISYAEEPTTSYEVQDETESATEEAGFGTDNDMGIMYASETDRGGETTDGGAASFETTDIELDHAMELSDNEARAAANLDLVMAVSHDPTASASFDAFDGDDASGNGSIAGSIASLVNSIAGSIGNGSANSALGSINNNTSRSRSQSPSKKVITLPMQRSPKKKSADSPRRVVGAKPATLLSGRALADDTDADNDIDATHNKSALAGSHRGLSPRQQRKQLPVARAIPLLATSSDTDNDNNRKDTIDPNNNTGNKNLDQYYQEAALTYSTSIGTIVGPMEPLSFVDGGSANDGIGYRAPPPNIRHLTTDLTRTTTSRATSAPTSSTKPPPKRKKSTDPPASRRNK